MLTVAEALALLQQNLPQPRQEECWLAEAYGRYLAAAVTAPEPSPRFTNSAMDGYAVRWSDVMAASKDNHIALRLVGESRAGESYPFAVGPGEAIRISTGAMLAEGVDTVVRVEDTSESGQAVLIRAACRQGQDVRQAGEEFAIGETLLARGVQLGPRQLALLAAMGISRLPVFVRPRVAILCTGSELIAAAGQEVALHQIRDSNSIMLSSLVRDGGGEVVACGQSEDDLEATVATLQSAVTAQPDIVLCSGGVSVGRHDHVKEAAMRAGFTEVFWRVRQKPGKPLFLARRGATLFFGLPGNPVSAFMCFTHYIRPVMSWLHGQGFTHPSVTAQAAEVMVNPGKRTTLLRVAIRRQPGALPGIVPCLRQGSHMISSLVQADGYVILEQGEQLEAGALVETFLI